MTLKQVFKEATDHRLCVYSESSKEAFAMLHGIKICKDKLTNSISIYNTTKGGNYYAEVEPYEYEEFCKHGWLMGVCFVSALNYKRKLEGINKRIQNLINKKKYSDKQYRQLKESRSRYMKLLTQSIVKLSKLKSNENN